MFMEEKRKAKRFKFRFSIQYEKMQKDGGFTSPVDTPARDISTSGLSFYAHEKLEFGSKVRVCLQLLEKEKLSLLGRVTKMELAEAAPFEYIVGAEIEDIDEKAKVKINEFINNIDIDNLLRQIDLKGVIDIHFVSGYPPITKRISGLTVEPGEPLAENVLKGLLLNILDEERYKEFISEKEMNLVFFYKKGIRFRVNIHIQQGKVEAVFRLIPSQILLPKRLGLPAAVENLIVKNRKGLIVVAGRTGAGKTTSLAAIVELLNNKRKGLILSIEKPIEYIHTDRQCIIKQREVGRDTLSFSNAAKNALRQSPDILVIGEILDVDTMEVAITAAETGMLVLTSIHAPDSAQALDRMVAFFPADLQKHMMTRLSLVLKGLITQNLIPRKDGNGFVLGSEILITNNALRRVIREGDWKQISTIIQTGRSLGMQSMKFSLEQYFLQGIIENEYFEEYAS